MRIEGVVRNVMNMRPEDFKTRTRAFALRVIRLVESLPKSQSATVIGKQLLRCGTSVGANYRAACRARSRAEFGAKIGIVEEECDESLYWMELLIASGLVKEALLDELLKEGNEILSLVVASIKTARHRKESKTRNPKSEIANPQSESPIPQSAIPNPQSAIGGVAADVA